MFLLMEGGRVEGTNLTPAVVSVGAYSVGGSQLALRIKSQWMGADLKYVWEKT